MPQYSPRSGRPFFGRVLGSCGWELWCRPVAQVAIFLPFAVWSKGTADVCLAASPMASDFCNCSQQLMSKSVKWAASTALLMVCPTWQKNILSLLSIFTDKHNISNGICSVVMTTFDRYASQSHNNEINHGMQIPTTICQELTVNHSTVKQRKNKRKDRGV